ncbi:cell envelope integrity protein TolA [Luteimonas sp. 3794]|uniref:cell envelope integrity protein TolA n=1 Tax=Luteimonas sp. 3794 TaxID=2817730 RepID=UPI00285768A1|nr:cell envelope integrity protein TolA [Luteimonas sp. 3794]MDR6991676.1 colicin import membrane protein [Luteimonas sp. 3794]
MRESRSDNTVAIGLSILVHVLLFGLILLGALWNASSRPESAMGSPVSADIIDPNALSAADRRALASRPDPVPDPVPEPTPEPVPDPVPEPVPEPVDEPAPAAPPQPLPEPRPEDAVDPRQAAPQEVVPKPDTVSQAAVRRDALAAEQREKEQEEKRRQAQMELAEQQKQQEAEEKRRLARQELEKLRAEREKTQREAQLAEQRLKQIAERNAQQASEQRAAAASASPPPGRPDGDSGLAAKYAAAIQEAVRRNWRRPDNIPLGQVCRMYITQLPGGEVINVEFDPSCPYDAQGRRSVEAAVRAAEPLPFAGFESVFNRRLNFNFRAQD